MFSQKTIFMQAISALSFLSLFLLLPLLFFSFIIFFLLLLFFPIICILFSAYLFSKVLRQIPTISLLIKCFLNYAPEAYENYPPAMDHVWKDDPKVENSPVSIEVDQREVPSLEESEDEEEIVGFGGAVKKSKESWQVHVLNSGRSGNCERKFYNLLSFWRRIEKSGH